MQMSDNSDELEVSDEDLELAAGGLKNITSNSSYTVNQTIYFTTYITNTD